MTDFVPFHQRPEWTDVKPVAQDDGPKPVCQIAYSNQCISHLASFLLLLVIFLMKLKVRETMDYFRAILQLDERSERALQLTAEVIALNPANYTAWHFRRQQILSLGKDVNEEVSFCDEIAVDNPKNYQVWSVVNLLSFSSLDHQTLSFSPEKLLAFDLIERNANQVPSKGDGFQWR